MIKNANALVDRLRALPTETEYLEFKTNFSQAEKEATDICALANSAALCDVLAAYKIWGIDDATHEVVGTEFKPRSKKKGNQDLEIWLRQNLSPNCNFEFNELDYAPGVPIVILKVWPAFGYPVKFDNKIFVRTGSSTQALKAGSSREIELWRKVQRDVFESQAAIEDVSEQEVLAALECDRYFSLLGIRHPQSIASTIHYLCVDGLTIAQDNGLFSVTNMGAALLARRLADFPTVARKALRVIRYDGTSRADDLHERQFEGGYAVCLEQAYDYIDGILPARDSIEGARRQTVRTYPPTSVRELVVNAVIHQDFTITGMGPTVEVFDGRIEFTNPGSPLIDAERLLNDPPRSRNEKLSALMRRFRFCEEAGSGWDKIIEGCERYHLPAPRIDVQEGRSMRVSLFEARDYRDLSPKERVDACYWHACALYERGEYATNQSLRDRFGLKPSNAAQVSRLIKEALGAGRIVAVDPDTSPRYMRYKPYWA